MSWLKPLASADHHTDTNKITTGIFDNGEGTLLHTAMATASISASNTQYFHTVAGESINVAGNNGNSGSGTEYFDVAYGHATGLGSSNTDYLYATKVIYKQFANLLLDDSFGKFRFPDVSGSNGTYTDESSGAEVDDIFVVSVKSSQVKNRLNNKFSIKLQGATSAGVKKYLELTDWSGSFGQPTGVGLQYIPIVSGAAGTPTFHNTGRLETFGHFYPDLNVMVFSAPKLSGSLPGLKNMIPSGSSCGYGHPIGGTAATAGNSQLTGSGFAPDPAVDGTADNAGKFVTALRQGGSLILRSEQDLNQTTHYCRLHHNEFNFSSNPTFLDSGSTTGDINPDQVGNPTVFVSGVGLYNSNEDQIAVAKLNSPIKKNYGLEVTIAVRLDA